MLKNLFLVLGDMEYDKDFLSENLTVFTFNQINGYIIKPNLKKQVTTKKVFRSMGNWLLFLNPS
jgi:hypothetical protein